MLIGISFIVVGNLAIYFSLRYPPKSEFSLLPTANGLIGGILLIIIGVKYLLAL